MSIATKSAACTSCGKRLTRKSWYYRNGNYFCHKRCWETEKAKGTPAAATTEAADAAAAPEPTATGKKTAAKGA